MNFPQKLLINIISLSVIALIYGCNQPKSNNSSGEINGDAQMDGWIDLFNGKDLKGWTQKNGTATYLVQNETIVGKTAEGSPNSFLCTEKSYSDFELVFEVKVDKGLNSGVQIRSTTRETTVGENDNQKKGRVIGPQVEIVVGDEEGSLSGFIWREATGDGWMISKGDPVSHQHFKGGAWNQYRIIAEGDQLKTWINGSQIEDVSDPKTHSQFPNGFIGLQVHAIGKDKGPYQVAWRNIKIRTL